MIRKNREDVKKCIYSTLVVENEMQLHLAVLGTNGVRYICLDLKYFFAQVPMIAFKPFKK